MSNSPEDASTLNCRHTDCHSPMNDLNWDYKARRSCSVMIVSADVDGFDSDIGMLTL